MTSLSSILRLFIGISLMGLFSTSHASSSLNEPGITFMSPLVASCDFIKGSQGGLRFLFFTDIYSNQYNTEASVLLTSIDSEGKTLGIVGLYEHMKADMVAKSSIRLTGTVVLPIPVGIGLPFDIQITKDKSGGTLDGESVTCESHDVFGPNLK